MIPFITPPRKMGFALFPLVLLFASLRCTSGGSPSDPAQTDTTTPVVAFTLSYASGPAIGTVGQVLTPLKPTVTGTATSFSAAALPEGLSLDPGTGIISGTPAAPTPTGDLPTFTVTAKSDGGVSTTATVQILVGTLANANASLNACAHYSLKTGGFTTGLKLDLSDSAAASMLADGHLVLSGPGINPMTFSKTNGTLGPTGTPNEVAAWLTDSEVSQIPDTNAVYTLDLYNSTLGSGAVAHYALSLLKRPLQVQELTSAMFCTLGTMNPTSLEGFTGGDLAVSWSAPSGFVVAGLSATLSDVHHSLNVGGSLGTTGTLGVLHLPASDFTGWYANAGTVSLTSLDLFGRVFVTDLYTL